jgi:hypothetical protein
MALGAILGSLIAAGSAPWTAGVLAALALAGAGVAYDRAVRGDRPTSASAGTSGRSGLSFAPALIALGVVIGVSIAAELAASLWSTLLLREEAPKLASISGLGAAFFSACQAALRFNADAIRLRISDLRIIVASFAIAAGGFALVGAQAGFAASVAGFALIGVGTGPIVPCSFALAARQSEAGPAVGLASASLFSALTRLPRRWPPARSPKRCPCPPLSRLSRSRSPRRPPPRRLWLPYGVTPDRRARRESGGEPGHCLGLAPIAEKTRRTRSLPPRPADTGRE